MPLFPSPTTYPGPDVLPEGFSHMVVVTLREPGKSEQMYKLSGDPASLVREYGGTAPEMVPCEWATSWFDFDSPFTEKYMSMLQILHRGPLTIIVKKNYDDDEASTVGTNVDHGEAELQESTIYTDEYARSFQFLIASSVGGERRQPIGGGLSGLGYVTRFQASIAAISVDALVLGEMRR